MYFNIFLYKIILIDGGNFGGPILNMYLGRSFLLKKPSTLFFAKKNCFFDIKSHHFE